MIKFIQSLSLMSLLVISGFAQSKTDKKAAGQKKVIVAYVTSWTKVMPDPGPCHAHQLCFRSCQQHFQRDPHR
jgi:hypothetical protein